MSDTNVESQLRVANAELNRRIVLLEETVREKEKAEAALRDSEKRYRRLFESAKDGILILDADTGKVVDVNPFLLKLLGYSYDELCGKYIWEIGVFKDIAASKDAFKVLQDNEYIRYEDLPLETLNGKPIAVEFVSNVYLVDHAKVIQCNIRDVTERRQGELALQESEEFKGAILDSVPSNIAVLDRNGIILTVNKSWVRFAIANGTTDGLPARHVDPGINYLKICRESRGESSERAMAAHDGILAVLEGIQPYFSLEYPCHSPTVRRWFTMTVTPLGMGESGVVVSHTDITERKWAEDELRDSRVRLKVAMDLAKLVQWEYDVKTSMYSFDEQFYALYGTTSQQEGGPLMSAETYARKFIPPEESHVVAETIAKTLATADPKFTFKLEHRIIRADGEERHIIVRYGVVCDLMTGKVVKIRGANQDVTERKRAEEELSESHRNLQQTTQYLEQSRNMLQLVIESIPVRVFWKDANLRYLGCNTLFARDAGFSHPRELLDKDDFAMGWREQAEIYQADDRKVMESGISKTNFIEPQTTPTDDKIWLNTSKVPLKMPNGEVFGILGIYEDITELKRAEEELRESEARLDLAIRAAHMGVWSWDILENKRYFDHQVCHLLGINPATFAGTAEEFFRAVHPDDHETIRAGLHRAVTEDVLYDTEYRTVWPDGSVHHITARGRLIRDETGQPKAINGVIWDITESKGLEEERQRMEAQLLQAQKMESLGTLAGGIAHDFNNILAIIIGYTEMVLLAKNEGNDEHSQLDEVLKAAIRAKDLVQQILAFSRRSDEKKQPLQVRLIVNEALKMLKATLPSTINVIANVTSKAVVLADSTQIHQIMMNLCTNAAHAMQENGGTLEVSLTDALLKPEETRPHWDLQPGPHVKLTIKDSGCGINPAILDRIFDPFFTTKEKGVGTGLGLSVVHGIAKSHGGTIEVSSIPDEGTTFHVFLPCIEKAPATEAADSVPLPHGRERVLVVDDEPALAEATKKMLERLGYQVDFRTNGIEALGAFRYQSEKRRFDLVITDMTMPHLTGIELAKELLKLDPNLAIVLCTGFSENVDAEKIKRIGIQGFLMKPVVLRELAGMVRKVLDEKIK